MIAAVDVDVITPAPVAVRLNGTATVILIGPEGDPWQAATGEIVGGCDQDQGSGPVQVHGQDQGSDHDHVREAGASCSIAGSATVRGS